MRTRYLAALWAFIGIAVGAGLLDLYVSRGARELLQKQAEFELGRGSAPVMAEIMSNARHDGMVAAGAFACVVTGCGWLTIWIAGRPSRPVQAG